MDIYNDLKNKLKKIKDFTSQTNNKILIQLFLEIYLQIIPEQIINLMIEDDKLFINIIDRYKNITEYYIKNSNTLENLLINLQKSLLKQNNNLLKTKFNKFDRIIYEYLDKNNFFQLCYNEKMQII